VAQTGVLPRKLGGKGGRVGRHSSSPASSCGGMEGEAMKERSSSGVWPLHSYEYWVKSVKQKRHRKALRRSHFGGSRTEAKMGWWATVKGGSSIEEGLKIAYIVISRRHRPRAHRSNLWLADEAASRRQ